ncbi:hypothetical protein SAMN04488107_1436 [Geodermatophilus saharensis]|uniref:Uncharacterized protein n=1 Tax=Geodermatophilus saharensis TaxID=1137994 RepID=A0A239BV19_9ACTN|nr:hypothetical protein SAMN04488107_1436 [Geodermatophilus saharensis]
MLDTPAPADPPVVLSLDVGSSSLRAAVRDPDLRVRRPGPPAHDGRASRQAEAGASGATRRVLGHDAPLRGRSRAATR